MATIENKGVAQRLPHLRRKAGLTSEYNNTVATIRTNRPASQSQTTFRDGYAEFHDSTVLVRSAAMQTVKQIIHDIANHLPEQATFDDAMYALYIRQKLERSLKAAQEGKVTSQEEMERQYLSDAR